jgi:hypothetical protein
MTKPDLLLLFLVAYFATYGLLAWVGSLFGTAAAMVVWGIMLLLAALWLARLLSRVARRRRGR